MLPCQGRCRRFDPGLPLQKTPCLRYTSPTIQRGFKVNSPSEARYPSGKGEVCKTFMRRFDPDPRLQTLVIYNHTVTLDAIRSALPFALVILRDMLSDSHKDTISVSSVPLITIFVRHSVDCDHSGDSQYKRCKCRKSLRYFLNGKRRMLSAKRG